MHQSQYLQIQTCCIMRISRQSKIGFGELSSFQVPHLSWHQGKAQLRMRKTPSILLLFVTNVEAVLIRAVWEQKGIKVCFLLRFCCTAETEARKRLKIINSNEVDHFPETHFIVNIVSWTYTNRRHAINANERLTMSQISLMIGKIRIAQTKPSLA